MWQTGRRQGVKAGVLTGKKRNRIKYNENKSSWGIQRPKHVCRLPGIAEKTFICFNENIMFTKMFKNKAKSND
jgi:hypothetical protein